MNKKYLYLVRQKDHSKFKVGFTSNPRARSRQYLSHTLDVEYIAQIEVSDKKYEKVCHLELSKRYKRCVVKGSTEWFEGYINYTEFYELINAIKIRMEGIVD